VIQWTFERGAMLLRHGFKNFSTRRVARILWEPQVRAAGRKHATVPLVAKLLKAGKHPSGDECANVLNRGTFSACHD
jgi:hypothetical protein